MEHMIAHETLPLKEEKQFIRDIKQLKQLREQFSSSMGKQDEVQQAFDQKDQIEERMKVFLCPMFSLFLFSFQTAMHLRMRYLASLGPLSHISS